MPRNKKTLDTSTCSDPSGGEFDSDSDDEMMGRKGRKSPPKKKPKKDLKPKPSARKPSPHKKKHREAEEEEVGRNQIDEDEDDEQRGLIEEYDEENLLNMEVPEAPQLCMAADGGDRLIITDIVVENFKSYYGTRRIGPFHHNFTSIIGPNGSGKSNVIDALLFVFGYKASKIRSKKVSVLIHSSAGKDDIPSCTVKISFQKILDDPPPKDKNVETTYQPVPNSSFSVSRTAYRNNTSSYKIDGVVKSFKEVAVRLKEVGIDLVHNRFLILQGEVEQIAMMKPKSVNGSEDGMLEYLEDIIGSSRYKVPIEKLAGKLEKLQAERSHQISKVNNANREKEALDEPVQTTISYMSVENEVAALMCKQYLIKKYNAQDVKKGLLPEQAKVTSELDKAEAKLKDVLVQLKERKEATDTLTRTLAKTQSDIRRSANELEVLVQRDTKRKNDLARVTSEMKKLHAEVKKEKEKLDEAQRAPEDAKAKIEQLNIKLKEYKEELVTATEQFDDNFPKYNKKTEADRAKKTTLEQEYSGVAAKLAEADSKCKLAEAALRTLVEEYEKKRTQLDELEKSLKTNQEKLDRDKKQREELQEKETEGLQHRSTARGELDTIGPRRDAINARLQELAPLFSDKQQEAQKRQTMNVIAKAFDEAQRHGQMKRWRDSDVENSKEAFEEAIKIAKEVMVPTDSTLLSLNLDYALFIKEMMNHPGKASAVATEAANAAHNYFGNGLNEGDVDDEYQDLYNALLRMADAAVLDYSSSKDAGDDPQQENQFVVEQRVLVDTTGRMQDNEPLMRALSKLIRMNKPDLTLFVGEALVGNEAVDQLVRFNQALADHTSPGDKPLLIDGMVLTKFDTIDDKVGAAISMTYITGQPIVFVGCGQTYKDLRNLNVSAVVNAILK